MIKYFIFIPNRIDDNFALQALMEAKSSIIFSKCHSEKKNEPLKNYVKAHILGRTISLRLRLQCGCT